MARVICLRLLVHCERRAASRADWTAGRSRAIRTAMIAMTTRSSIRVKARRFFMGTTSFRQGDRKPTHGERRTYDGAALSRRHGEDREEIELDGLEPLNSRP